MLVHGLYLGLAMLLPGCQLERSPQAERRVDTDNPIIERMVFGGAVITSALVC